MLTARTATVAAALALALTACTGDDEPDPDPESPEVEVPEGVTLTSAGSAIPVGESASVVYKPRNAAQTVITVSVKEIARGKPNDLDGYDLDGIEKGSVPYYVNASIRNAGPAVLSDAAVPLYGLDSGDEYFERTRVNGGIDGCKPLDMSAKVATGKTVEGCLVFTVPPDKQFQGVQVRTSNLNQPVTWKP